MVSEADRGQKQARTGNIGLLESGEYNDPNDADQNNTIAMLAFRRRFNPLYNIQAS